MAQKNIYNPTTGQQGYQVEGAPIPAGWQPIGTSSQTPLPKTSTPDTSTSVVDQNTTTPSLVDRYATDKKKLADVYNNVTQPDEQAIKDKRRAEAQASIDAIRAKYAQIDLADQETIDLMKRERRASNVLGGLSGSNVAGARTVETAKQGEKIRNLTEQQKTAEIESVLANADARASEEFAKQKENFIANTKDKYQAELQLQAKIKDNALAELKTLASNKTFADLEKENPNLIKQYMAETGLDYNTLKATYASSAPSGTYQWDQSHITTSGIVVPHIVGGKVTLENLPFPAGTQINDPKNTEIVKGQNGSIYVYDKLSKKLTPLVAGSDAPASYIMPKGAKNDLMKFGFKPDDITLLESDIRQYGLSKVLEGLPENQKRVIQDTLDKTYSADIYSTE